MKNHRRVKGLERFLVVAAMIALTAGAASSQESTTTAPQDSVTTPKPSMMDIFTALSTVYGYSLDASAFADPAKRQEILNMLGSLAANSDQLDAHGRGLDPSFDFMRRSLSRDANEALERFQARFHSGSRFVLGKITENCVTCHTKLPAERQIDLRKLFLEVIDATKLPLNPRANFQVAIGLFDDAMKTYEEILTSPRVTGADLATLGVFENYLGIAIDVMNDTKRPTHTLKKFVDREDMSGDVKANVKAWIASMDTLDLRPEGDSLAAARRMVAEARAKTKSRSDRSHLVEFIGSITLVHRYFQSEQQNNQDIAEAFYLLGVAESYVARSYWLSETDFLLEKAIRLAPQSDVGKQALAFLEDYTNSEHSAPPTRTVPPGLQANLDELRKLTEQ